MAGQNTISIGFKLEGDTKGFEEMTNDANALKVIATSTVTELEKLKKIEFGKIPTQAQAAMRSFNGLNAQVQYLARELPALAISPQTFFLAISNNLPMLADEIDNVRVKNEALIAQGKNAAPVWQQVAKSLFSWQTAMAVGVTLLTVYGDEVVAWAGSLFKGKDAIDELITKNKEFRESVRKDYSTALISFEKLRRGWIALGDDMDAKQQFIKDNASAFKALHPEIDTVQEAESALIANTTAFKEAMLQRAMAAAAYTKAEKMAADITDARLKLENTPKEITRETITSKESSANPLGGTGMYTDYGVTTKIVVNPEYVYQEDQLQIQEQKLQRFLDTTVEDFNNAAKEASAKIDLSIDPKSNLSINPQAEITPQWNEDATTLGDISNNIKLLNEQLQKATVNEAEYINEQIELWQAKADAITNAGKSLYEFGESGSLVEEVTKSVAANNDAWSGSASTIKDIESNVRLLNEQLQTASIEEAAAINREIELWNSKADAIKNAGLEAESTSMKIEDSLIGSWGGLTQISSSVESLTSALSESGNAWESVTSIIDSFIGLYQGIQTIVDITRTLTAASAAQVATKGAEAIAETAAATARGTAAATNAAAATAIIATNKLAAASFKELAASEYMAAHAAIPFAGFAIGAGFTTAMMAVVSAAGIPAFANGGVVSGPTLAMVGEYAGASNNPEIIAPLDKLRSLINTDGSGVGGTVDFEIDGYKLRGILNKVNSKSSRG